MYGPAHPWDLRPGLGVWPLTCDLPSFLKTSIALSGHLPTPPAARGWAISRPAAQAGRASVYIAVPQHQVQTLLPSFVLLMVFSGEKPFPIMACVVCCYSCLPQGLGARYPLEGLWVPFACPGGISLVQLCSHGHSTASGPQSVIWGPCMRDQQVLVLRGQRVCLRPLRAVSGALGNLHQLCIRELNHDLGSVIKCFHRTNVLISLLYFLKTKSPI